MKNAGQLQSQQNTDNSNHFGMISIVDLWNSGDFDNTKMYGAMDQAVILVNGVCIIHNNANNVLV